MPSTSDGLWWVSSGRATFGLIVRNGIVVEAAPYGRKWCVRREWTELMAWLRFRGYALRHITSNATSLDNVTDVE